MDPTFKRVVVVMTPDDTKVFIGPPSAEQTELKRKISNVVRVVAAACAQPVEVLDSNGSYAMTVNHETGLAYIDTAKAVR